MVNFTSSLFKSVAPNFPSKFFSTGGDELNVNCFTQDAETQQLLNSTGKTFEQALDTFTQTTHQALEQLGKTPVVWEGEKRCPGALLVELTIATEMVLNHNLTLSNETVVM